MLLNSRDRLSAASPLLRRNGTLRCALAIALGVWLVGCSSSPGDSSVVNPDAGDDGSIDARSDEGTLRDAPRSDGTGTPNDALADARGSDATGTQHDAVADTMTAPDTTMETGGGGEAGEAGPGDASGVVAEGGCAATELLCNSVCVANGVQHCGTCTNDCASLVHVSGATTCTGGQCSFPASSCAAGWADCNGVAADGCETDITTSAHCGSCSNACASAMPVCTAPAGSGTYACATGCPAGQVLCNGGCVDTSSNPSNCGSCGNVCPATVAHAQAVCASSACTFTCNSGYSACAGGCVDVTTDNGNCGNCAHACTGGTQCTGSQCACTGGMHLCSAACVANDVNACGPSCSLCVVPANGAAGCDGVACNFTCNTGYVVCGSACCVQDSGAPPPTFTTIYTTIIGVICTGCHSGTPPSGNLDMSTQAAAYANLVGVAAAGSACGTSGQIRVVASNSGASLLYNKVNGTQTCGAQMPRNLPPLSAPEIALIKAWIDAGALNN